jgi:hypothetical protein
MIHYRLIAGLSDVPMAVAVKVIAYTCWVAVSLALLFLLFVLPDMVI